MSLNWCIGNIHSLQWNPTQQLKINYAKSKKADSKASSVWFHFQHSEKAKLQDRKQKQMVVTSTGSEGGTTTGGLGMEELKCGSYKDHRHPSKLKSWHTLTREKFTVCKWQLFKKSFPHSIKQNTRIRSIK